MFYVISCYGALQCQNLGNWCQRETSNCSKAIISPFSSRSSGTVPKADLLGNEVTKVRIVASRFGVPCRQELFVVCWCRWAQTMLLACLERLVDLRTDGPMPVINTVCQMADVLTQAYEVRANQRDSCRHAPPLRCRLNRCCRGQTSHA